MPVSTCPRCGTTQQTPDGVAGYRCSTCQTNVWRLVCRRCKHVTALHGSISGSGTVEFRCENCRARNQFSKQQLRSISADVRTATRAAAAARRQQVLSEREQKAEYLEGRQEEVADLNTELEARREELGTLLTSSLASSGTASFDALRITPTLPTFSPGALAHEDPRPDPAAYQVAPLSKLQALAPGAKVRHQAAEGAANEAYQEALRSHDEAERDRKAKLAAARAEFDRTIAEKNASAAAHNLEVDQLEERYRSQDPDAVVDYMTQVLESGVYPEGFPIGHRLTYSPASKQLVVELELPNVDVVPDVREYRYVKSRDSVTSVAAPAKERKLLYEISLAQLVLRTVWAGFRADPFSVIDTIVLNGHVRSIDARTGADIYPCVVSVRTTREHFDGIDLTRIDPLACLKGLNASVSRSPSELVPVRPLLEFNMSDPRFIQESDVLSTLDTRPNLMELSPSEFESLITNLFEKMGLETRLTQASRDGGVDCVAYDPRPIFGGKVVIQAKRYKNTVGVSAVRDLFGTMQNEGASKGILVTTSGYGQASHEFASGKPLEMLDGANLLYLLKEHAGLDAKIEPPDDWVDPIAEG